MLITETMVNMLSYIENPLYSYLAYPVGEMITYIIYEVIRMMKDVEIHSIMKIGQAIEWYMVSETPLPFVEHEEDKVAERSTPIVQGAYYDYSLTEDYRYWLLGAYVAAGVLGVFNAWLTIVFFQWWSAPEIGNF